MARSHAAATRCAARTLMVVAAIASIGPLAPEGAMAEPLMPRDPTRAWALDEGTGATAYPEFGTDTGALRLGASWSPSGPFSYAGNHSAYFAANNDYVAFPGYTTIPSGGYQFWAYTTDMGGGDYYLNSPSGPGRWWLWLSNGTGNPAGLGLNGTSIGSFPRPPDNEWNHFVITWDESLATDNVKVYVTNDLGQSVYSMTKTLGTGDSTGEIRIGSTGGSTGYAGFLDEVAFWNVPLSAENVDWLYRNSITTIPEPGTGIVAGLCLLALLITRRRRRPPSP